MLRDEILEQAIQGTGCTDEWAAMQTLRLYRQHVAAGQSPHNAVAIAKQEMQDITREALRIRRREQLLDAVAPWCVIVMGVVACVGWWYLWE